MSPRECGVDIALRWGSGFDTVVASFVNIIATPKAAPTSWASTRPCSGLPPPARPQCAPAPGRQRKVDKDDILAGLTAVVTVRLAEPQFEGQTKEVLGTPAVRAIVARILEQELTERFERPERGKKQQADQVLDKGRRRDEVRIPRACTRRPSGPRTRSSPRPSCQTRRLP